MRAMALFRRALRWLGFTVLLLLMLVIGAFGLLQTRVGLEWLGGTIMRLVSGPGSAVALRGLHGIVPFGMRAERIEVSDSRGLWVTLDDVHLDLAARELLAGRVHIGALTAEAIEVSRLPEMAPSPPVPLSEYLRLPSLPVAVAVDRLAIGRIVLGPAVLGERVEAALDGHAVQRGDASEIALDLHRTDSASGALELYIRQSGANPVLALRLTAREPTGLLLGSALGRDDRLPLLLSLTGEGPLSAWHGRLEASAGQQARLAGDISIVAGRETTVTFSGAAAVAPLLSPEMAALAGDSMPVMARATVKESGAIALDALSVELAAGTLTGDAALAGPDGGIAAHLRVSLPRLASASGFLGAPVQGSAELTATISGTADRPQLEIEASGDGLRVAASGAEHVEGRVRVGSSGGASAPIEIAAQGRFRGLAMPDHGPSGVDRDLDWSLTARAMRDGSAVELSEFTARGAGIDIRGSGQLGQYGRTLDGRLRLSIADLRPFTGIFGQPIAGALTLDATAQQPSPDQVTARLDGSIAGFRAGIPALDALAGDRIAIAGSARRDPGGALLLDQLTLTGAASSLTASGHFDPISRRLAGRFDAAIGSLRPVGAALGTALSGQVSLGLVIDGTLDRPRVQARIEGRDVAAGAAMLDRVRIEAALADAAQPRVTVAGNFQSGGLAGRLSLEAEAIAKELVIRRLRLTAAESVVDADLRIDLATLLASGSVRGRVPDLAPWSRLAGMPVAGKLDLTARLEAQAGQRLELTVNGDRLSYGARGSPITIGHIAATARLNDLLGTPFGTARATLAAATFPSGGITQASLTLDSPRPGRFAFTANAKGQVIDPLTLALEGSGDITSGGSAMAIRIARLSGALGAERFQLTRPLTVSKRGNDLALSDLALGVGGGQITGNAARRGAALSLELAARNLSIASAARLAGYQDVSGTVALNLSIGGTVAAPQGRFTVSGSGLRFALPKQQRLPTLGLDLGGSWNGRELALNGRVTGLKGDTLELSGSAPLVLTAGLGIAVPPQGRLALRFRGAGEIASLADLLPLGEDRFAGHFVLDAAISGTPAAPAASGHLTVADGRYENFATGAVLTRMRLDLIGDRDRLSLREFSAGDTANGTIAASGKVILGATGPTVDLSATLQGFRILGRDDAVIGASGTVAITGAVASPKVTAQLTADQGDLRIPESLPPSVTRLQVVEVNRRTTRRASAIGAKPSPPALPATLDIRVAVPGHIFVRGRGLDSEWRGQIKVAGTTASPQIVGALEAIRGSFDLLGKTFKVTRGNIVFSGGATIDPRLDIVAEVSAGDITAQVTVSGAASSPKIAMTSTPALPQDQILSRVLFNRGIGQITAAEGIQVAQAAATLAGGGPGVLDRLRSRVGLDRLVFGSAPSGMASSSLNPATGGNAAAGTAISGGKYVAEGVYVGASQGLTPQSSKVVVEIELRPHVTVEGNFSQSGGSGIGLNYKYDY
jgi:translocation and assembly module TamB